MKAQIQIDLDFNTKDEMQKAYNLMTMLCALKANGIEFDGGLVSSDEHEKQFEGLMPEFKAELETQSSNLKYLLEQNFSTSLA